MLIPLENLVEKYKLQISGVLHVGAHLMEEKEVYDRLGIIHQVWIEGDPLTFSLIEGNKTKDCTILNHVIFNKEGETVTFHRTNNRQSSSILHLKKHIVYHPTVLEETSFSLQTETLSNLIENRTIPFHGINFLNLDIQGVELQALQGMKPFLQQIEYIYTEINTGEVYEENSLLPDLDSFLEGEGFRRVETSLTLWEWGDAFYIRV